MLSQHGQFLPARIQECTPQQSRLHIEVGAIQRGFNHRFPEAGHAPHESVGVEQQVPRGSEAFKQVGEVIAPQAINIIRNRTMALQQPEPPTR